MAPRYPALDLHRIPHEVAYSAPLVERLMRIAESRPFLDEHLGTPMEVTLLRKSKVRAITYSNQIEGNTLGEEEVTAVLRGKRVAGPPKDIREVTNYLAALDYVEKTAADGRQLRFADICDIQRLVTDGLIPEKQCGRIRTVPVSIVNAATGEKIETCPEPHALRDLLDDLWRWLDDHKTENPYSRAFAFHFLVVAIHPFADGNGRTARLAQHLLLLRGGQAIARFVPSETAIMRSRDRYYSVLRQARALGRLTPALEYLAECFAVCAEATAKEGKGLLRRSASRAPSARQRRILARASRAGAFSLQDVARWLPQIPRRTLERDLATLARDGKLRATGERKGRKYRAK